MAPLLGINGKDSVSVNRTVMPANPIAASVNGESA
jgi:hypothetical protein